MRNKKNKVNPKIVQIIPEIPMEKLLEIMELWKSNWEKALSFWSKYTKLSNPKWAFSVEEEVELDLTQSFAMIRLTDHSVRISIRQVIVNKLEDFSLEIMAHEIGHHVYCPSDLTDMAKLLARIQRAIPTKEHLGSFIANLYTDMLINDKLKRDFNLKIEEVYKKINTEDEVDELWTFYMRTYEILWGLPRKTLAFGKITDEIEGDAQLGNSIIRSFSKEWLKGGSRFAALCYPYLLKDNAENCQIQMSLFSDMCKPGDGDFFPSGIMDIDPDEIEGAKHPCLDESLGGTSTKKPSKKKEVDQIQSQGQLREPFQYGQILRSLGINISDHEMAVQYYKEMAVPYLVPFPSEKQPQESDPFPEGIDVWDVGSSISNINWFETFLKSPVPIPGYTIVETHYGETIGNQKKESSIDLDIYVDCSGSMPNPQYTISYLTLAGVIIMLSALRAGSKVQATLWSGAKEFFTTEGFINNEIELIRIVTGFIGGSTAFPIHILRDTYSKRPPESRKVHILVISDDGVTTMFDKDEKKNSGWDISEMALKNAGGGGTFVLNLYNEWTKDKSLVKANKMGWDIFRISQWEELTKFARDFSEKHYNKK